MKVSGKVSNLFLEKVTAEGKGSKEEEEEETTEVEGSEAMDRETFDKKEEERKNILSKSESTLYKFNEFLAINEAFDADAAVAYYKETYVKTEEPAAKAEPSSGGGGGGAAATGFTPEQGNLFRAWANRTKPAKGKDTPNIKIYGKESKFDLDKEGGHDNKFIRKAWAAAVSSGDHGGIDKIPTADKAGAAAGAAVPEVADSYESLKKDFKLACDASDKLVAFWKSSTTGDAANLFKKFKSWNPLQGGDDEKGAGLAYKRWANKHIQPLINKIGAKAYRTTLNNVVDGTVEQVTDAIQNDVNWELIDPSKLDKDISAEELKHMIDTETFGGWSKFWTNAKSYMKRYHIDDDWLDI